MQEEISVVLFAIAIFLILIMRGWNWIQKPALRKRISVVILIYSIGLGLSLAYIFVANEVVRDKLGILGFVIAVPTFVWYEFLEKNDVSYPHNTVTKWLSIIILVLWVLGSTIFWFG